VSTPTCIRAARWLAKGNPKELEQWSNIFIFDIYTMVAELQQDDPKNFTTAYPIKTPIFSPSVTRSRVSRS